MPWVNFEFELESGEKTVDTVVDCHITCTPTRATRYYPGDPLEYEPVEISDGSVYDSDLDDYRELTESEKARGLELAYNDDGVCEQLQEIISRPREYYDY